jgi:hypothetical protein
VYFYKYFEYQVLVWPEKITLFSYNTLIKNMMARTRVTKRVKASAENATTQSDVASIAEPGTPVSTVTVTDVGTPVSTTTVAKLSDDLVDSDDEDSENTYQKPGIYSQMIA